MKYEIVIFDILNRNCCFDIFLTVTKLLKLSIIND